MSDVERMIAEACKRTGPLVGYPDVIEVLLCIGLPLETLAALRTGTWKAVPVEPTDEMARPLTRLYLLPDQDPTADDLRDCRSYLAVAIAMAPSKPGDGE